MGRRMLPLACLFLFLLAFFAADSPPALHAQGSADKCCGYFVKGNVWIDANSNQINDGELPAVGWTVQAYNITSSFLVATATTDAAGDYSFSTPVGCSGQDALFALVLQPGFSQTFPLSPTTHTLTSLGGCGTTYDDLDFGVVGEPCDPHTETWTLDGEFNSGVLNGTQAVADNLELTPEPTTLGFAWVANSNGTVSKIDIATGNEVGRYYTGPPDGTGAYWYLQPSRTAVDADGNCWVLNRSLSGQASLTQILATGGIDRNASTVIETSQDNVTVDGMIGPSEILPWGDDERVARHYLVGGAPPDNGGRALTIDKTGYLWVGLYYGARVLKLDPNLSTVTYQPDLTPAAPPELVSVSTAPYTPYGLALSPSGNLYAATLSEYALEIDPGVASGGTGAGPAMTQVIKHPGISNYGIAVDQDCIVWVTQGNLPSGYPDFGCLRWDPTVGVGNPALGWSHSNPGAQGFGRGITVDYDGNIWMTTNDTVGYVAKYAPTDPPTFLASYPVAPAGIPVGVGVASDQNMVIIDSTTSNWVKLNKTTGANIPLPGPQLAGPNPYTYSDFTGSLQSIVNQQQGFWTAISDAGSSSMVWNTVSWAETVPAGTSVSVEYRVANSVGTLSSASWMVQGTPGPIPPILGRYMEVRVRLVREVQCGVPFITPLVHDVTVAADCDPCVLGPCEPIVVQCDSPQGAVVDYPMPTWNDPDLCDGGPITCNPPSGSVFPVGTTQVVCSTVTALGDTISCEFPVIVVGDCDKVTGGCCVDDQCTEMTEGECDAIGGIYLGDDSDCEDGCDFTCQRPPRNMLAWFPLDDAPGGITKNIANPPVPAFQGGTPTPNPGTWVTASYKFDRVDAADEFTANDHPTLDFYTSDFSIDAWVRVTNFQGINTILDKRQGSPLQGYRLFLANGYPALELAVGGTTQAFALSAADGPAAYVANGAWKFLAVTVDRSHPLGVRFYVDGVPVGSPMNPTAVTGNAGNTGDFHMGRDAGLGGTVEWFDGDLDEVEVFRRALTRDEITSLFNAGPTGKCREACYVPDRIVACSSGTVTTSITICNYDDVSHLYSWGISPAVAGCSAPISGFSPPYGSVTVGAGDCVSIPVTIQVPSSLPVGGTACFNVSILNHDTGRYFGCNGQIRKNGWWCVKWKKDVAIPVGLNGFVQVHPAQPITPVLQIAHIGPNSPATLDVTLQPVWYEDESQRGDNLGIFGLPPGEPIVRTVQIPPNEEFVDLPVPLELIGQQYLNADKILVLADDDMDGSPEPIAELIVHTTTDPVTSAPDDTPGPQERIFKMVPNPFNPQTTIQFNLPGDTPVPVGLRIFDLRGRKVKKLLSNEVMEPGLHTILWAGDDHRGAKVASGVYFVRLVTPRFSETVKAVLVK